MDVVGQLTREGGRYEFTFTELRLTVRGTHPEWVLAAAAEIIADTEKLRVDGEIEQLEALASMDEADEMDVDDARFSAEERFGIVPQCTVTLGDVDYRWVGQEGRSVQDGRKPPVTRVHQVNLTRDSSQAAE
ncbi:MAG: hypothetical protein AAF968_00420 [Pseudomonadota bacterium]